MTLMSKFLIACEDCGEEWDNDLEPPKCSCGGLWFIRIEEDDEPS
jgi:hypothetical protein